MAGTTRLELAPSAVTVQQPEVTSCNFTAPIATLGALRNPRELLLHPNCTQIRLQQGCHACQRLPVNSVLIVISCKQFREYQPIAFRFDGHNMLVLRRWKTAAFSSWSLRQPKGLLVEWRSNGLLNRCLLTGLRPGGQKADKFESQSRAVDEDSCRSMHREINRMV